MKITITAQIADALVDKILKEEKLEAQPHDFGYFRNVYHNRPVWVEDIQPGVCRDNRWVKLPDFINQYLSNKNIIIEEL